MIHKRDKQNPAPALPVADYEAAIAGAVAWLGDRHLLAQPVHALRRDASWDWQSASPSRRRYLQWLMRSSSSRAS